jgi:hypothetical protein
LGSDGFIRCGSRANVKKGQLKNNRTFTSRIDHHEEELVFTEAFTKTDEQEQEQGYGRGKKRRGGNKSSLLN